jgi:hypothetical protein
MVRVWLIVNPCARGTTASAPEPGFPHTAGHLPTPARGGPCALPATGTDRLPLEATLSSSLAQVQAAEYLYETYLFPDRIYMFKHALTHEVAYSTPERLRACRQRHAFATS